jgi:hypothetical protein
MDDSRLPESLTRRAVLRLTALGVLASGLVPDFALASKRRTVGLRGLSVRTRRPFKGDRRLLATVCPGSKGRKRAEIHFRLDRPALVQVEAVRTRQPKHPPVWTASARLPRGEHHFTWQPHPRTAPGTYLMRITVEGSGRRKIYGGRRPAAVDFARAPVVRVLGVEAAFRARSYTPGKIARMRVSADAHVLAVQIFRSGPEEGNTNRPDEMKGVAMAPPRRIKWDKLRNRTGTITVRLGDWPSGLYFARLITSDGRRGFAPFIIRPATFGATSRVAVVLPTNTWQAYNFRDTDGDGWGDTWYAGGNPPVELDRPFLNRGVPPFFRRYDLGFLRWLHATGKSPDFLSEEDLGRFDSVALRRIYDLVIFPGHTEYVTDHAYTIIEKFRDLGGNLIFLSANNFFWKVSRRGNQIRRVALWRNLGRPEVRVLGSQYRANDDGKRQGLFVVTGAEVAPWFFNGTGLGNGSTIGDEIGGYGIEIDATTLDSPPATHVLAMIPDLFGAGVTAQMTYYESPTGARVFNAGALDFGGSVWFCPPIRKLLENLWQHMVEG